MTPSQLRSALPLIAAIGIIGSNSLALSPMAASVAAGFGAEPADVLRASAAYGIGTAGAALTLAPLADRFGAARTLAAALALLAVALGASAAAPHTFALVLAQGLAGIAAGAAIPAAYVRAAESAAPGLEARTLGLVLTGWMLSMVAGVSLASLVADHLGWRVVYAILALGTSLLVLGLVRRMPAARPGHATSPLGALRVPGIGRALFSVSVLSLGFYGTYSYVGTAIQTELGRSASAAGLLPLLYGLGFGVSAVFDRTLDRAGPRRALPVAAVTIAAVYLLMAAGSGSFTILVALAFVWGVFQHMGLTLTVMRLTALDPARRGAIMGLNSAAMYAGVFGGALLFRPLFEAGGITLCLVVSAGLAALMLAEALLPVRRALPADESLDAHRLSP